MVKDEGSAPTVDLRIFEKESDAFSTLLQMGGESEKISCRTALGSVASFLRMFAKGSLNRHTRYRPATTTRNTATQRSCHSVD